LKARVRTWAILNKLKATGGFCAAELVWRIGLYIGLRRETDQLRAFIVVQARGDCSLA
jgi:hypothetical protein